MRCRETHSHGPWQRSFIFRLHHSHLLLRRVADIREHESQESHQTKSFIYYKDQLVVYVVSVVAIRKEADDGKDHWHPEYSDDLSLFFLEW